MPVVVTRNSVLTNDLDGDGVADVGEALTITTRITNANPSNITNLQLFDTQNGLTVDPASVRITPIAFDDTLPTIVGNTPITFSKAAILGNDVDPNDPSATFNVQLGTGTNGTIVDNGDGTLTFTPATGFQGTASFTYQVVNTNQGGEVSVSPATVSFTVSGQVWYVDSGYAGANGAADGSYLKPFTSLANLNGVTGDGTTNDDVDGAGDTIFVYDRGTTYTGGIVLEASQKFYGDGHAFTVNGLTIGASANNSVLTQSTGTVVTLSADNTISGINVAATGTAAGMTGSSFGTLNVDTTSIQTATGQVLSLISGNAGTIAFTALGSTGTTTGNAILLNNVDGGTFNGGTISIAGSTADGINISAGSSAAFTFGSTTVNNTTGDSVELNGANGAVTFASLTANGAGANGLNIVNATNAVTVSGGSIGNSNDPAGFALFVSGGTGAISVAASLTKTTTGSVVAVSSHGTGTIDISGAVSATGSGGNGIVLASNSSGAINFTGNVTLSTGASTGLAFTNGGATGADVSFTGGALAITTSSGNGISAVSSIAGSGSLTITGANNIISQAAGGASTVALNVSNVNIGGSGLTFRSVSANAGANGIVLNNTGTQGGLTVTGDTGSSNNGSGGLIQNTSGAGILLTNTRNVSFDQVNLTNTGGSGVQGTGVTNFSHTNSTFSGNGNGSFESGIAFNDSSNQLNGGATQSFGNNISGTLTVTGNVFTNPFYSGVDVQADAGTVTTAIISGNTFSNPGFAGVNFVGTGNASTSFSIDRATIANNNLTSVGGTGIQVSVGNANASGPGAHAGLVFIDSFGRPIGNSGNLVSISGNTVTLDTTGAQAITVATTGGNSASRTQANFEIVGNGTVANPLGSSSIGTVILVGNNGYSDMAGHVDTNRIAASHTPGGGGGNGIAFGNGQTGGSNAVNPRATLSVQSNVISGTDGNGILLVGRGTSGTAYLHVAGNNVSAPVSNVRQGIRIDAGNTSSLDDAIYLNIHDNVSAGSGGAAGIGLRHQGSVATTHDFGIYDEAGGPTLAANPTNADIQAFVNALNPGSQAGGAGGTDIISGSGFTRDTTLAPTGSQPAFVAPETVLPVDGARGTSLAEAGFAARFGDTAAFSGDAGAIVPAERGAATQALQAIVAATPEPETGATVPAAATPDAPASGSTTPPTAGMLTQAGLETIAAAAIARWAAAGATPEQIAAMRAVSLSITDMAGLQVGTAHAGSIEIDNDGAGLGWFIDMTPGDDAEFAGSGTRLSATADGGAAGRMDLLTVLMHELGHQIGLADGYTPNGADDLMYGYLGSSERRLPAAGEAARGTGHAPVNDAYILSPVGTIGTLPAGKAVDITYVGTVTGPTGAGLVASLVNTATASYTGGSVTSAAEVTAVDSLTLGDRIFLDANRNGVFDTGEGVAGVTLTLFADTNGNGVYDDGTDLAISYIDNNSNGVFDPAVDTPATAGTAGAIALTVTTGTNGLYSFGNLAAGDYIVRVNASNFVAGGALAGGRAVAATSDPDNNVNNDSNAAQFLIGQAGTYAASQAITLNYNSEPTPGTGNDTNNTLDMGFVQANSAPVIDLFGGDSVTYTEDTNTSVRLDAFQNATVSDASSANFNGGSLTASISSGFVAARDRIGITSGGNVTVSGNNVSVGGVLIGTVTGNSVTGQPTLVLTFTTDDATPARVQEVVRALFYGNGSQDPVGGTRGITVTLNDGDGTADGGSDTATYNTSVNVVAINDAPFNQVPGSTLAIEDTPFVFGNNLTVFDADVGTGNLQVTIGVAHGTLTLSGLAGLTFTTGDGTADATMTFRGTPDAINTALNGLTYAPTANYSGADTLTISTNDLGNSGDGGAKTTTNTVNINVQAVPDAPSGTDATITINEDTARVLTAADFGFTDPDGDAFGGVRFTSAPTGGTIRYAPAGVAPVTASLNTTYSAADVAAGYLTFVPNANLNGAGAGSITFAVVDNSPQALVDPTPNTLTFNITAVNDAPAITDLNLTVTFAENTVNAAPQLIDGDVTFTDVEGNVGGGSLAVSGLLAEDRVAIRNQGTGAGQIGVSGGNVTYGGVVIGTFSGGTGAAFNVALNVNATNASVEALIENLTYQNVSDTPTGTRTLSIVVTDAAGASSGVAASGFQPLAGTAADPFPGIDVGGFIVPSFVDLDGDGDLDAVIGNVDGNLFAFRNNGPNTAFTALTGAANPFNGLNVGAVAAPAFVDLDGDGDKDAIVGTFGGTFAAFRNSGAGAAFTAYGSNPITADVGDSAYPTAVDIDGDGDLDIVSGAQNGLISTFRNNGPNQAFTQLTGAANPFSNINVGFDARPTFLDVDGDGRLDLLVGAGNAIRVFRNNGQGQLFTELTGAANPFNGFNFGGSAAGPAVVDLNGDGRLDVVVGNSNGFLLGYRNIVPVTLNVTLENDAPVIANLNGDSVAGIADGSFVYLDGLRNATVSDPDSANFDGGSLTVAVANAQAGDSIALFAGGGINGNGTQLFFNGVQFATYTGFGTASQTFSFDPDATPAAVQALIRALAFRSTSTVAGTRTVNYTLNDGDGGTGTTTVSSAVELTVPNAPPTGTDSTVTATEDTRLVLSFANFGTADSDGTVVAIRIVTLPNNGTLYIDTDGAGGSLGTPVTAGQTIARSVFDAGQVVFVPIADSNATGSFTFAAQDNLGVYAPTPNTLTVAIAAVNDAPVLLGGGNTVGYVENGGPVVIDSTLTLSDVDSPTLTSATIAISSGFNPGDFLGASLPGGFSSSYLTGTGVLTISGTGSLATYQAILRSVTFISSSDNPTAAQRVIRFQVNDGGTANNLSGTIMDAVNVTPVNDAPAGTNTTVAATEDTRQVLTAANFGFTDVDGNSLDAVRITTVPGGGNLYLDTDGAGGSLGTLLVSGSEVTAAQINAGQLVYVPNLNVNGADSFTFQVRDNGGTSNGGVNLDPTPNTLTFNIAAVSDQPVLGGPAGSVSYTENGTGTVVNGGITIADDGTTLVGATVAISAGRVTGDTLNFANQSGITGNYNATTGVLTLSGTASLTAYQAALRSITFSSTSDNPTAAARTVSFVVNDGGPVDNLSNTLDTVVNVTPLNDAPAGTDGSVAAIEDTRVVLTAANFGFTDVDGNSFDAVRITTVPTSGNLYYDTDGAGGSLGQLLVAGNIVDIGAINAGQLVYVPAPNANGTASFTFQVRDNGPVGNGEFNLDATPNTLTFNIAAVNDAPTLGLLSSYNATEDVPLNLKGSITVADADAGTGIVTVTLTPGNGFFGPVGLFNVTAGTSGATVSSNAGVITVSGTLAQVTALFGSDPNSVVTFTINNDTPPATTTFTVSVNDNGNSGGGGPLTASATATVNITAVDDGPTAVADSGTTTEVTTTTGNVLANDTDPDGGGRTVTAVNGSAVAVGQQITLPSGALLTLNADGTYTYNPNGAYYYLVSPQTAAATGAVDGQAVDTFTYTVNGGSTATVSVTVTGVDNPGSELRGNAGNNVITGTPQPDLFNLSQGGVDTVSGGDSNDGFYFGNTLTAQDSVDGQGGSLDQLGLQGNYVNLVLGPNTIRNVEQIVLFSGRSTAFGAPGNQSFVYNITSNDANVAAGQVLVVSANQLAAGETSTFNASAETNGALLYYGGLGTDTVIGSQQNDGFFFGEGAFGANDVIDGQGGSLDQLALQGNYTLTFGFDQLRSVENLVLISASDIRFPSSSDYTYNITLNNANVAAGGSFSVTANTLTVGENLTLNARSELDAGITVFSGAGDDRLDMGAAGDRVFGGAGNDLIYGNGGADQLTGGAGNDIFAYRLVSDSTASAQDRIFDFSTGDRIDLSGIGTFTLVDGSSFTAANQVRIVDQGGGNYLVLAETNGDGQADMSILVTSDHVLRASDFNGVIAAAPDGFHTPVTPAEVVQAALIGPAVTDAADVHGWHGQANAGMLDVIDTPVTFG